MTKTKLLNRINDLAWPSSLHRDLICDLVCLIPEPPESPAKEVMCNERPIGRCESDGSKVDNTTAPDVIGGGTTQASIMEMACAEVGRQITIEDFVRRGPETWPRWRSEMSKFLFAQGDAAALPLADQSVDLTFCSPPY